MTQPPQVQETQPSVSDPSQRIRELIDEVARKDNALQQYRELFETMGNDYEVVRRRGERVQLEFETLTAKQEDQQQELIALKAKNAMLESRVKQSDEDWERRTRQLRQELAAAIEERDTLAKEREREWQQTRILRTQSEEQRRQQEMIELEWKSKLEETRRETEAKVRAALREREDLLRVREMELQRGSTQVENRFADLTAETQRLQDANNTLSLRVSELQRSLQRQENITQRLESALSAEQQQKMQLEESMALERQTHKQRLAQVEDSYRVQLQDMERLCEQLRQEQERQQKDAARTEREFKQTAQRAKEAWLQQQQQLELTIESLRGDISRERIRLDKSDEERQRTEALLQRTRRELEAAQQQEESLQETNAGLHKIVAKRDATQMRLESEITRLIAAVAERERETERWRCIVDRMEWQSRLETQRGIENTRALPAALSPPPTPPPPLPPPLQTHTSPATTTTITGTTGIASTTGTIETTTTTAVPQTKAMGSTTPLAGTTGMRRQSLRQPVSWSTPNQQHLNVESIECTPSGSSPLIIQRNNDPSQAEDEQSEILRSLVQEVLQEYIPQNGSSNTTTNASAIDPRTSTSRRRTVSSHLPQRSEETRNNVRPIDDSPLDGIPAPSPINHTKPLQVNNRRKQTRTREMDAGYKSVLRQTPYSTTSADTSLLQSAAPLFPSTANNTSLDSSSISQSRRRFAKSHTQSEGSVFGGVDVPVSSPSEVEPSRDNGTPATAATATTKTKTTTSMIERYAHERDATEKQMMQALRGLDKRQKQLLSTVVNGEGSIMEQFPIPGMKDKKKEKK
ncbi:uncharacterized protein TM35_000321710 [Trypanosoma theileri]|uniref:Uncharacterized protein n=1 Tax=Trypanosoma theileri TaxID=67003 RepID=A0A1X0NMB2_9TRYP|nr:uncharacterized protein TM35_000321710 [Trypanosoma theileri]ORC85856.1 hypothetical protein TM35_000321710 [Trypanosoma theileri]